MNIGTILKETRKQSNLTQKQLQEKSGVSFVTINRIEAGANARISIVDKLFDAMNKKISLVVTEKQDVLG